MKLFLTKAIAALFVATLLIAPLSGMAATKLPDPVSRMYDELAKVTSVRANTIINVKLSAEGKTTDLTLNVDTVTDTKDKVEIGFTLTASSNMVEFRDALGASSASAKGILRVVSNKKAYLYFSSLPDMPTLGYDLNKLEGKWIDLTSGATSRDFIELSGKKETFAQGVKRMKAALENHPAFTLKEEGSTGSEYRYKMTLNPAHFAAFMQAADNEGVSIGALDASDLSALKSVTGYFTIDRTTYLPKSGSAIAVLSEDLGMGTVLSVNVSVLNTYTGFNEKVNLTKPKKVVSLEKIIEEVMGKALSGARDKASVVATKSSMATARAQSELFYDGNGYSYSGLCTDPEMKGLLTRAGKSSSCFATATAYAAVAKSSAGYICVDSTGNLTTNKKKTVSKKDMICN